jgi:glycosyltransferase involved in cell wall biosynthesis
VPLSHWIFALCIGPPCLLLLVAPFLALRFTRSVPRLADQPLTPLDPWPSVSILIPARDEADTVREATLSRMATEYPAFELVLVDDRSTDDTGRVMDELAAGDDRVRVEHVTELPDGWLGKNHANKVAAEAATGDWLLFTDADVHFAPDLVKRAVAYAEAEGLDFLALIPDMWETGFLHECAVASFGRMFAVSQRPWRTADPKSELAMGIGAFNLVRRSALEQTEGLEWLAYDVVDDVALARLLKKSGARCGAVSGMGLAGLTWYPSLSEMVRGLEKNTFASVGCSMPRLVFAAVALVWLDLAPYVGVFVPGPSWLTWLSAVALVVGWFCAGGMARWMKRPLLPALLVPVGALITGYILVRAGWVGWRRGGVVWRDTFYPSELLRERARVRF